MFEGYIAYHDKPRFNIGTPNQWYEDGFFFHEGNFYFFSDDRHDNNYDVKMVAKNKEAFIDYCEASNTTIPERFWTDISDN